jgi:hypothetical protein
MKISDFFDPENIGHINAFLQLEATGFWPDGFGPTNVEPETVTICVMVILSKMAKCWIKHKQIYEENRKIFRKVID